MELSIVDFFNTTFKNSQKFPNYKYKKENCLSVFYLLIDYF
jgi:hypothetical protein